MDKNRHEKDNMSKGAAQEVSDTENNEENQHEAGGWMRPLWCGATKKGLWPFGRRPIIKQKKASSLDEAFKRIWQLPTLPHCGAVPSAMRGLTSLFGMGRGEHPRQNHHKSLNNITYWEVVIRGNFDKKN
jgi:hypothetical protein